MEKVRYNHKKWNIDAENKELVLADNKKVRVDVDEVWEQITDKDQEKIILALTSANKEFEEMEEETD